MRVRELVSPPRRCGWRNRRPSWASRREIANRRPPEVEFGDSETRGFAALRETYPTQAIAPGLVICPIDAPRRLTATDVAIPWDLE